MIFTLAIILIGCKFGDSYLPKGGQIKMTDGFDFPVGKPNAKNYYSAQRFGVNEHLGDYKIDLPDGDGDLCEVKDSNIFIKFNGHFGYAGYSTECILKVEYYSSTVYKLE